MQVFTGLLIRESVNLMKILKYTLKTVYRDSVEFRVLRSLREAMFRG